MKYSKGVYKSRLYRIWTGIIDRCTHRRNNLSKHYADAKIKICEEWRHDFMAFYNWALSNGYSDNLSIDRIDNNKGYNPENCSGQLFSNRPITKATTLLCLIMVFRIQQQNGAG